MHAVLLTLVTVQACAPGFGGLCHQEGGLLNSASAWEEILGFLVTGGFAWSDPLHLFISAARFLSVVCQVLWQCACSSSSAA